MGHDDPRPHDQVPRAVAREALALAKPSLPACSSATSRNDFTQHPWFAVLARKTFVRTDDRGVAHDLTDLSDLRYDLGLDNVPRYSTRCDAATRLRKGGPSPARSSGPARPRPAAA